MFSSGTAPALLGPAYRKTVSTSSTTGFVHSRPRLNDTLGWNFADVNALLGVEVWPGDGLAGEPEFEAEQPAAPTATTNKPDPIRRLMAGSLKMDRRFATSYGLRPSRSIVIALSSRRARVSGFFACSIEWTNHCF